MDEIIASETEIFADHDTGNFQQAQDVSQTLHTIQCTRDTNELNLTVDSLDKRTESSQHYPENSQNALSLDAGVLCFQSQAKIDRDIISRCTAQLQITTNSAYEWIIAAERVCDQVGRKKFGNTFTLNWVTS